MQTHNIQDLVNDIVEEAKLYHKEGEKYFDFVDERIKNSKEILDWLIDKAEDKIIISTGEISQILFDNYPDRAMICYPSVTRKLSIISGPPTHDPIIRNEERFSELIQSFRTGQNKIQSVYVDDSIYSGLTRDRIRDSLSIIHEIQKTIVVYDGMHIKDPDVISLYRYHN